VEEIASAGRARIEYQADRRALAFRLEDVISHSWDRSNPETYQVAHREEQKIIRPPDIFETEMLRALKEPPPRNLREQSVAQILRSIDESRTTIPKGPARRRFVNEARVELHKKFAIPGACAVFAVLGAGLALRQRRGGRAWGFVISLPVFALEYALLTAGEQFADRGRLPAWLAMWMGNIAFGLIGIGLLVAAPRGGWDPSALAARLRRRPEPPAAAPPEPPQTATPEPAPGGSDPPGRAVVDVRSRRRFGLPAVDAYLLRTLAPVFLLVASSLGLLFALFATLDLVDEVARWGRSLSLLLAYVANILPMFLVSYVLPVGLCASTLITFALLSRTHELTALRSAGLGPFRVSAAFLAVASAAAVGSFALLDSVLPAANQKALQVRDQIRGRSPRSYRQVERRWVFASRGDLVTYSEFSPERREILDLGLFRFKPGTFEIRNRLSAERAVWSAEGWILTNGWERSFEKGAESYAAFGRRILSDLDGPHYFTQEWKTPDQMNLRDLTAHTRDMQRRGHESLDLRVALHRKIAVPAVCVVLVLVALPFGLRLRGRGALVGLGIAVSLAAAFFFAMQACGKLGEVGILPPALAAWVPGAVFSGGGLYLMAWSRW
jgi:LPS export ABC transporter permease LptG